MEDLQGSIEAIIFSSESPVNVYSILEVLESVSDENADLPSPELIESTVNTLIQKYEQGDTSFEIKVLAGGYQYMTKAKYGPIVQRSLHLKDRKKLGKSALETLSIIAYKQPVTKPEMEFIRGVSCDYSIHKLLEKQLVELRGRADTPGKPLLYGTTNYFMEYFGLKSLSDLPGLKELKLDEEKIDEAFRKQQSAENTDSANNTENTE